MDLSASAVVDRSMIDGPSRCAAASLSLTVLPHRPTKYVVGVEGACADPYIRSRLSNLAPASSLQEARSGSDEVFEKRLSIVDAIA